MAYSQRKTPEGFPPGSSRIGEESSQQLLLHLQSVEATLFNLVIFTGIHLLSCVLREPKQTAKNFNQHYEPISGALGCQADR